MRKILDALHERTSFASFTTIWIPLGASVVFIFITAAALPGTIIFLIPIILVWWKLLRNRATLLGNPEDPDVDVDTE